MNKSGHEQLAEHEGTAIVRNRTGSYTLVTETPNGRELLNHFEKVAFTDRCIMFYAETRDGTRTHYGGLDGGPDKWGDIGDWVLEHGERDAWPGEPVQ